MDQKLGSEQNILKFLKKKTTKMSPKKTFRKLWKNTQVFRKSVHNITRVVLKKSLSYIQNTSYCFQGGSGK